MTFNGSDVTTVNKTQFLQIATMAISENANPAVWFFASGGSVLLMLALLCLLDRADECKSLCESCYSLPRC